MGLIPDTAGSGISEKGGVGPKACFDPLVSGAGSKSSWLRDPRRLTADILLVGVLGLTGQAAELQLSWSWCPHTGGGDWV